MKELCGLLPRHIRSVSPFSALPSYRTDQLLHWIYRRHAPDYCNMSSLPPSLREELSQHFAYPLLQLQAVEETEDRETTKFLWQLPDRQKVESVWIRSSHRRTLCLSSQVGCKARCSFCASGKRGWIRHLTAAEIVEQIVHVSRYADQYREHISHLVFMGMGEPLDNYDHLIRALELIADEQTFHLSTRRVTISTVGVIENIYRLAKEKLSPNLAISLHAPNQKLRQKLIPYARLYPLEELLKAADDYTDRTGREITYEYILLSKINDRKEHAYELASLCQGRQCCVNLIPYNPVKGVNMRRSNTQEIDRFRAILHQCKVRNTQRYTKGRTINAACGQLAYQAQSLENKREGDDVL